MTVSNVRGTRCFILIKNKDLREAQSHKQLTLLDAYGLDPTSSVFPNSFQTVPDIEMKLLTFSFHNLTSLVKKIL